MQSQCVRDKDNESGLLQLLRSGDKHTWSERTGGVIYGRIGLLWLYDYMNRVSNQMKDRTGTNNEGKGRMN